MHTDAAPPGLRLLVADRYRVDARLLVPGARVDAVDTRGSTGRRVRIACVELDGPADSAAARLEAWAGAYAAGLPLCEALHALDDDPGPLLVLAAPPDGPVRGDAASLAAQARVLAGALAERGLRAGELGPLDLALARDGTLLLTAPPPVAAVVDPRAEADRLAVTVAALAATPGPPGAGAAAAGPPRPGGAGLRGGSGPRVRPPGRRGLVRAATLVAAGAAVLVLVAGTLGGRGGPAEPDGMPLAEAQTPPPATATIPDLPPLPPAVEEGSGDEPSPTRAARPPKRPAARPAAARPKAAAPPVRRRPRAHSRPVAPAQRPAPRATPEARPTPAPRPAPRSAPRQRPASRWALGPDGALGPR